MNMKKVISTFLTLGLTLTCFGNAAYAREQVIQYPTLCTTNSYGITNCEYVTLPARIQVKEYMTVRRVGSMVYEYHCYHVVGDESVYYGYHTKVDHY